MKRRVLSLVLALVLCVGLAPRPAQAAESMQIATAEDLMEFVQRVDFQDEKGLDAILTADIDLAGRDWLPIAWNPTVSPIPGHSMATDTKFPT